jgi:hypothetical protein
MRAAVLLLLAVAASAQTKPEIHWRFGPATLELGKNVELRVAKGWIYIRGDEMGKFLRATGNDVTGTELAVVGRSDLSWFAVVSPQGKSQDQKFKEYSREEDGREVVILTVVARTSPSQSLQIEVVAEKKDERLAEMAAADLLQGIAVRPPWNWRPWAAALLAAALAYLIWRQRGK